MSASGSGGDAVKKAFPRVDLEGHDLPPSPAPSSPHAGRRYNIATELVYTEGNDQYNASSVPIYQSATFKQTSGGGGGEYDYTRSGNPTRTHLERHLAKIMSAQRALVVSSGMAAMDVISRLLRPGDEVVTGDDLYGGTNRLLKYLSTNGGIIVHHVDTTAPEKVREVLTSKTAMVLLETPTNPLIKIVDIPEIAAAAHEANPNCIVSVDNTMMSPLLLNPLELGADIVYESGTKYLSGHHDLMAGVIAVNDMALGERLYFTINASGCGLSPFDSWLLLRGVKTLKVRMDQQQTNAQRIAEFLESHGFKVRYPGLRSHPQYELHHSMARGSGAVLSFETGDVGVSERIVESAKLWAISVSFGCVNSLISMPCRMSHASIDEKTRRERAMPEDLIRLCVGIEDVDDLIDDLQRAARRQFWPPARPASEGPPLTMSTISEQSISTDWNTNRLGARLGVDVASAATAGALTCPVITVIDRAIIEKAAKGVPIRQTITSCFRSMITKPAGFFLSTPFLLIYTLYTATYLTANTIDTFTSTMRNKPFETVFPGTAKFLTTTAVNMGICVYKDARFARIFGASSPASASASTSASPSAPPSRSPSASTSAPASCHPSGAAKVPKISYSLFCLRDSITIFASFNIPALVAPSIPDAIASTPGMKAALAQFSCPALMQFASTPMHLLGLDLYNRQPPGGLGWRERASRIRRDYIPSCFARMGKIVPAYGVGGVVNVRMRASLMDYLERTKN
ncbi:cystathionine beta-lyase STR3 [Aspergillus ibericus CBS 121593]|uniref:Cystathionine beta-lyase n=1 Tax=Aspergillus ibericus CBS 121593 TaxID=1448316 RepID=A0A395GJ26_9EURO|nr:cystathionine beta-l [Aspergillus ibericus CBS 121593]RAK95449.1 cystathionine beta-l [Aspergillus ibericus CBS 121593]